MKPKNLCIDVLNHSDRTGELTQLVTRDRVEPIFSPPVFIFHKAPSLPSHAAKFIEKPALKLNLIQEGRACLGRLRPHVVGYVLISSV